MGLLRRLGGLRRLLVLAISLALVVYVLFFWLQPPKKQHSSHKAHELKNITPIFIPVDTKDSESVNSEVTCLRVSPSCIPGEFEYFLSTSLQLNKPIVCVEGKSLIDNNLVNCQGIIVVVYDSSANKVDDSKCFPLSSDSNGATEREFLAFVAQIEPPKAILLTTYVFSALRLNDETKLLLSKFGAPDLKQFTKPYSLLFIGQKGLQNGAALQKISDDGEGTISISGCCNFNNAKVQLVTKRTSTEKNAQILLKTAAIVYGNYLPNCGNKNACPKRFISVKVYSGKSKDDHPNMCVDGRFVMDQGLNGAGRGLNIVVMNTTAKRMLRVAHFDTYQDDSSALEVFLEQMLVGETIVVVSSDEASNRLSSMAKQMFYELGSALVQNLKFRASWYMVGQKGLKGFTPFEELNYASGNDWAPPVDNSLCIPDILEGQKVRADPKLNVRNDKKRHFCMQYDGYEDFCDDAHIDEVLTPAPQFNKSWEGHDIYKVPIAVVAGLSHNALRMTLQTLLKQQGVDPKMVTVFYDDNYPEGGLLAGLFGFESVAVNASGSYAVQMIKSIEMVWHKYNTAAEIIVIEEELLLTADFLFYMGQLLPVMRKDPTVACVSAWNDNGFVKTSTMPQLVYRIEWFPGLAFMMSKKMYKKELGLWGGHCLVPDVSRVVRRHADGLGVILPIAEELFHRDRAFTTQSYVQIENLDSLTRDAYMKLLNVSITRSHPLNLKSDPCVRESAVNNYYVKIKIPDQFKLPYVSVFFEQKDPDDYTVLNTLCKCFGLFHSSEEPPRGLFMGVLRFSYEGKQVFLIGSGSAYYKLKGSSHYVLRIT